MKWITLCLGLLALNVPAQAGPHSYFDSLASRPEVLLAAPLRSDREIERFIAARRPNKRIQPPAYDAEQDGTRWKFSGRTASVNPVDALRIPLGEEIRSGNALFYFEARWDSRFPEHLGPLHTHKAFRFDTRDFRKPVLEMRARYGQAGDCRGNGFVAKVDGRVYHDRDGWQPDASNVDGRRVGPNAGYFTDFCVRGDTWTSFWVYVDYATLSWSYWAADDTRAPVKIIDGFRQDAMDGAIDGFRYQWNSSQEGRDAGVTLYLWGRNFVALRNVADPQALIDGFASAP